MPLSDAEKRYLTLARHRMAAADEGVLDLSNLNCPSQQAALRLLQEIKTHLPSLTALRISLSSRKAGFQGTFWMPPLELS